MNKQEKPQKPYDDFPLFPHASGQWAKKIKGKMYYFGKWENHDAAWAEYERTKDYLFQGLLPPEERMTLADVLNKFDASKKRSLETGDITERTYREYIDIADVVASTIGKHRAYESITPTDLERLRVVLSKGKQGQLLSPFTHKNNLTYAGMIFHFASENLGLVVRYKGALKSPAPSKLRARRNEVGERMFTAEEVRTLIKKAPQPLKGMILMGINCGFAPVDCIALQQRHLDLINGFHNMAREKTHVARRCPLWKDTVKALKEQPAHGSVFNGRKWTRFLIAKQFKELCESIGIYRENITTYYSLRRTFETVAKNADVNQSAIDRIMGHERSDMSEVYNQKTFDTQLLRVTEFVRKWVAGSITL